MTKKENKFIVAIGALAGGLKPLQQFFDSTPNDHATYIILRHLKPDYKSILGDILKQHSKLEICETENNTPIDQNKIYMLPSGMYMTIKGNRLYLEPRKNLPLYPNTAIDIFLQSLAEEKGAEGIAVILSGLGSDGTYGAKVIKEKGGMVIVQAPQSADFNSMPLSVINNHVADFQLLPKEMPGTILTHINKWIETNKDK